ncbi:hypothetical protein Q1695_001789 [Nippostrongylus brasiliensis]|nr:hypothetical protein Q1695_001789 [Nippostrongylus brasiliensis]
MFALFCARRLCPPLQRGKSISTNRLFSNGLSSAWRKVKQFVSEGEKSNFDAECVRKAYKSDRVNEKDWLLIYRDQGASRSFLLVSVIFPVLFAGVGVIGYDLYRNERQERLPFVQKLVRDVNEIGLLAVVPGTAIVFVIGFMLRIHQMRLLRIYQNRATVEDYLAVSSKNVVQKQQIRFSRDSASACYFVEDQKDFKGLLAHALVGNIQVEKRRFHISDDGFLANNYRSYMLNETSAVPRL